MIVRWCRVEAPIANHSKDFAPYLENYKAVQIFPCRRIEIKKIAFFGGIFLKLKSMRLWNQKLTQTYYQRLEFVTTIYFNCSILLTLALKSKICVMALLVSAGPKFSLSLIEILVPYRLSIGSWLKIGSSNVVSIVDAIRMCERSWHILNGIWWLLEYQSSQCIT